MTYIYSRIVPFLYVGRSASWCTYSSSSSSGGYSGYHATAVVVIVVVVVVVVVDWSLRLRFPCSPLLLWPSLCLNLIDCWHHVCIYCLLWLHVLYVCVQCVPGIIFCGWYYYCTAATSVPCILVVLTEERIHFVSYFLYLSKSARMQLLLAQYGVVKW